VWEQYDQSVGADTVQRPGGDAAVVRVHGSRKALAMTTDCTPRYCHADPVEGGKQAVAEAYRNLCAVGAKPLAITNCLNFGNPQRPEIMGQLVGCLEGMAEACHALDFPVVSGNVSLYNETKNEDGSSTAILPTPAIGGVGLLDDWKKSATIGLKGRGHALWDIGCTRAHTLGQSLWLAEICDIRGRDAGPPPSVDCEHERKAAAFVAHLIDRGIASAVHDVSDGGMLVAVAEMALASNIGATINSTWSKERETAYAFGEDQGRYIVTVELFDAPIDEYAEAWGIPVSRLGETGGDHICLGDGAGLHNSCEVSLADLRAAHEGFFPRLMGSELTPEF
jgi:phosphoribosylformylglycinamidine (FGAM) synthase-like enzyme